MPALALSKRDSAERRNQAIEKFITEAREHETSELVLSNAGLAEDELSHLLKNLKISASVKSVRLSENNISDAQDLAIFLQHNPHLEKLDLTFNNLDDNAVEQLAATLQKHNLSNLNLSYNNFNRASAVRGLLEESHNLEHLSIVGNELSYTELNEILYAVSENKLKHLSLGNNEPGEARVEERTVEPLLLRIPPNESEEEKEKRQQRQKFLDALFSDNEEDLSDYASVDIGISQMRLRDETTRGNERESKTRFNINLARITNLRPATNPLTIHSYSGLEKTIYSTSRNEHPQDQPSSHPQHPTTTNTKNCCAIL